MALIDFSKFTFTNEQIRAINEIAYEEVIASPFFGYIHTIVTGIEFDKEVGFLTGSGKVGVADPGCGSNPQDWAINTRSLKWEPKRWEIFVSECATQLEGTAAQYVLRKNIRYYDLVGTDYMNIVSEVLINAIYNFLWRVVWFGDTNASAVGSGSGSELLTNATTSDPKYFTLLDGFFKQLETQVTTNPAQLVAIPANAETTKALQDSALTPQMAYDTIAAVYYAMPAKARRSQEEMQILVTSSIADKYQQYLSSVNANERMYRNVVDGMPRLYFNGIEVVRVEHWDDIIREDFDLGATWYKPHRVVAASKRNLLVGMPTERGFEQLDVWYERKDKYNYIRANDALDAKIANPAWVVLAQ